MIDPLWLGQVCRTLGADLHPDSVPELAKVLGDLTEALPYLAMSAGAFADWPLARTALQNAARELTQPTRMRPARTQQQINVPSDLRSALLNALLADSAQPDKPKAEVRAPNEKMLAESEAEPGQHTESVNSLATEAKIKTTNKEIAARLAEFRSMPGQRNRQDPSVFIQDDQS